VIAGSLLRLAARVAMKVGIRGGRSSTAKESHDASVTGVAESADGAYLEAEIGWGSKSDL